VIGDGQPVFTPLIPGQEVTIVHGPQGGWHVLASIQLANMIPFVTVEYTVDTIPDLTRVSYNLYNIQIDWADCVGELVNIFGYLEVSALEEGDLDTPPELLVGRTIRLTMKVTDVEGRTATASIDVVGKLDAIDLPDTGGDSGSDSGTDSPTDSSSDSG
jgi:hypothetical protein